MAGIKHIKLAVKAIDALAVLVGLIFVGFELRKKPKSIKHRGNRQIPIAAGISEVRNAGVGVYEQVFVAISHSFGKVEIQWQGGKSARTRNEHSLRIPKFDLAVLVPRT